MNGRLANVGTEKGMAGSLVRGLAADWLKRRFCLLCLGDGVRAGWQARRRGRAVARPLCLKTGVAAAVPLRAGPGLVKCNLRCFPGSAGAPAVVSRK